MSRRRRQGHMSNFSQERVNSRPQLVFRRHRRILCLRFPRGTNIRRCNRLSPTSQRNLIRNSRILILLALFLNLIMLLLHFSLWITVFQLADFLVYLFEIKRSVPSTIKGYRSAIGRTISILGGPDFGQNEYISLLVRSFSLERLKQNKLVPQWNLGLVLAALNSPPFEPAEEVDLRFLYYKCCFLLALASGIRRSEIHAFSVSDSCLRFNRNKSSVTLLTDPCFLWKNQIPDRGAEPVILLPLLVQNGESLGQLRLTLNSTEEPTYSV
jgi:hypothetical protein